MAKNLMSILADEGNGPSYTHIGELSPSLHIPQNEKSLHYTQMPNASAENPKEDTLESPFCRRKATSDATGWPRRMWASSAGAINLAYCTKRE